MTRTTPAAILAFLFIFALGGCGSPTVPDGNADAAADGSGSDDTASNDAMASDSVATDTPATDAPAADTLNDGSSTGCVPARAFDDGATYDRTLYVSTTGDDATGDGTRGRPFASVRVGVSRATPGTRVVLLAGTYRGSVSLSNVSGMPGRPIALVGEGAVVLDAMGMGEVMHVSDPRYFVLENLTLQNASVNGLNIDDGGSIDSPADYVVLRNLRVSNVGTGGNNDCIKLSGVDHFHVLDSDVTGCNAGDAIDMVGCHDGVIRQNHFHDTVGSGGIQAKGGSARVLIHGNRFVNVNGRAINAGGSTGLAFFRPAAAPHEAAEIRVFANVFVRPGNNSGAAIAYVGCDACVFAQNTLIEPRTFVARILQESIDPRFVPSRNGLFVNNLIVFNYADLRAGTFVNVGPNTAPATFVFGSNLWFALDRPGFTGPVYTDGVPAESMSVIQRDPMLLNRAAGDYHVPLSSPARAAGRAVPGGVPGDFDRSCYATPPTVGAFEAR